ncbi:diguanylate cyclase (GGDEF)-like protein [Alteromonadaceae bacterium 2753L.S.0a.02]|nr:diguanylate cyclase (GGDEF)-like protein [Alteromonadaceae bacterium 2753L.S.0a.02]
MTGSHSQIKLRWIYIAFFISLVAMLAHEIIPKRHLQLIPGPDNASLYSDANNGGTTTAEWVNRLDYHFKCNYTATPANYKYCGINITQGDGDTHGVDFSKFDTITMKVTYIGSSPLIRVYLRHFDPAYSSLQDTRNSAKYNRTLIPVSHLSQELTLKLRHFSVADWWMSSHGASPELLIPEYSNIINLGLDTPTGTPPGTHEFRIHYMLASGYWISREHWYLAIVIFWFAALILVSLNKYFQLRRQVTDSKEQLTAAITKAKHLEEESAKYKELSLIDPLTQTLNRRGLLYTIDRFDHNDAWAGVALILADVDHLNAIIDSYGHDAGDRVLAEIGTILSGLTSGGNYIGRWGNEEFILICPDTSAKSSADVAEKARRLVHSKSFTGTEIFKVTVSVGISVARPGENFEDIYHRADHALYEAKHSGRNCVVVAATDVNA